MNFFRGKNRDPKNGNTLWATTFFRVVRSGYRLKIWTVHIHTRDHAPAFLWSRPGQQSCGLFLVGARYVSDQTTRTSNFSPPAASRYSAACRLEEMSSTPLCSCGRVIGEPWKSKLNVKGLHYTYRTWRREMFATITWIKNHFQNQHPVKNSDPARNFDTGGFRKSQNNIRLNRSEDIKWGSFHGTVLSQPQAWSAQGHVLIYYRISYRIYYRISYKISYRIYSVS